MDAMSGCASVSDMGRATGRRTGVSWEAERLGQGIFLLSLCRVVRHKGSLRQDGVDVNASLVCAWTFTLTPLLLWANCFLLIRAVAWAVNTGRQCFRRCKLMAGVLTLLPQGCESTGSA